MRKLLGLAILAMVATTGIEAAPALAQVSSAVPANPALDTALTATIRDGDSIMLDTGTTTSYLARELLGHRRLTVVTNYSDIARTLSTINDNRVYMAGGELRSDNGAAFGVSAIEFISHFTVGHAVITTGAIDAEIGVMDYDLEEAEFARAVVSRGKRAVVITDHTKFGRQGLVRVCEFGALTELFTDRIPPRDIGSALKTAGVSVVLAS